MSSRWNNALLSQENIKSYWTIPGIVGFFKIRIVVFKGVCHPNNKKAKNDVHIVQKAWLPLEYQVKWCTLKGQHHLSSVLKKMTGHYLHVCCSRYCNNWCDLTAAAGDRWGQSSRRKSAAKSYLITRETAGWQNKETKVWNVHDTMAVLGWTILSPLQELLNMTFIE